MVNDESFKKYKQTNTKKNYIPPAGAVAACLILAGDGGIVGDGLVVLWRG